MRLVKFLLDGQAQWGELQGENVCVLAEPPYEKVVHTDKTVPLSSVKLLAPCDPTSVVCVGLNYYDHIMEGSGKVPDSTVIFLKPVDSVNHPDSGIPYPKWIGRLDYEGELAFVIKKTAKNVKKEDFADYILGYTCFNDVTARELQRLDGQWARGKGFDGFAPAGPALVTEFDCKKAGIQTRLNGEVKQNSNIELLMYPVPNLVEFISAFMTLHPGDIVATGTPAGIGPMKTGDVVEVEIEGIGTLKNHVL